MQAAAGADDTWQLAYPGKQLSGTGRSANFATLAQSPAEFQSMLSNLRYSSSTHEFRYYNDLRNQWHTDTSNGLTLKIVYFLPPACLPHQSVEISLHGRGTLTHFNNYFSGDEDFFTGDPVPEADGCILVNSKLTGTAEAKGSSTYPLTEPMWIHASSGTFSFSGGQLRISDWDTPTSTTISNSVLEPSSLDQSLIVVKKRLPYNSSGRGQVESVYRGGPIYVAAAGRGVINGCWTCVEPFFDIDFSPDWHLQAEFVCPNR